MITVFIVDDHEMIIQGIHTLLQNETDIEWLGSAKNHTDLFRFLKNKQPDVLLLDINLPVKTGLDLCKEITELYPLINIIGLSNSDQPSVIRKMLENGAKAYLLKDATKAELLTALKKVTKGEEYVNYSVSEILKASASTAASPLLTRREKEILELISDGMTNQEIAQHLFLTVTTIDSHRKNMLTKLGVKNTAALIKLAVSQKMI